MASKKARRASILLLGTIALGQLLFGTRCQAEDPGDPDIVVVCPSLFEHELTPWVRYRQAQGLQSVIIRPEATAQKTQSAIAKVAGPKTGFLLIVGDAPVIGTPTKLASQVPMHYPPTTVTAAWQSTPTLSTDFAYGDLNHDGKPELAVGRLPVDRPEQLAKIVQKIITYESSNDFGDWRNELQLVAGVGGFGLLIDTTIETVARAIITGVLPAEVRTHLRFGSPDHTFYPKDGRFTQSVLSDYQRGSRFWVYAGHGRVTALDDVLQSQKAFDTQKVPQPVLNRDSAAQLSTEKGRWPIALMLACYTGAMDASEDSISERMWLSDNGPIAVVAGSRVTMPYGNTTAAVGLIDAVYQKRTQRLGEAWLNAINSMQQPDQANQSTTRQLIDAMAKLISPANADLSLERREHSQLYSLIGDPLLLLNHDEKIEVSVKSGYDVGKPIQFSLISPIDGTMTVQIDRPLGAKVEGDANDLTLTRHQAQVQTGKPFQASLSIPDTYRGPVILRAHVAGDGQWASAAAKTNVRQND